MSPRSRNEWHDEDHFAELEAYLEEHGRQPSERSEDPKQRELALWFRMKCHALLKGEIPEEQAIRLQLFGIEPVARLKTWALNTGIQYGILLKRMKKMEGGPGITFDGISLQKAFYTQAQIRKRCADLLISVEEIREHLQERLSPELWVNMTPDQRRQIEVCDKKLVAIARLFGIQGNPFRKDIYLQLGQAIWENHPIFSEMLGGTEEVITAIKSKFTPEEWAQLSRRNGKSKVKVQGKKLVAIARLFGIEGNPIQSPDVHLLLGQAIWGKQPIFSEMLAGIEGICNEAKRRFTPEQWMKMSRRQKHAFEIHGRKLRAISRLFGIAQNPICRRSPHAQLGEAIFGRHPIFTEALAGTNEIRAEIQSRFTPEQWAAIPSTQTKDMKICGRSLGAIATLFEIEGHPVRNKFFFLQLGRVIWGKEWKNSNK